VLIVDDDPLILHLLSEFLRSRVFDRTRADLVIFVVKTRTVYTGVKTASPAT
jgi:hypothetical protein